MLDKLSVKEGAKYIGVTEGALRMAIHEKRMPSLRENGRVYLRRDALNYYKHQIGTKYVQKERCRVVDIQLARETLDPRACALIEAYARQDVTLEHLADIAGLVKERVRQIIEEGLKQLGG